MSYVMSMLYNKKARGEKLSDLEYLAIKAFEDKIVRTTATIASSGAVCSYTVPDGKTAYVLSATIRPISGIQSGVRNANTGRASLTIDGTAVGYTNYGAYHISSDSNVFQIGDDKFNVDGLKLEGDGSKTIQIRNVYHGNYTPSAYAILVVLLETTGDSPAV